MSKSDKPKSRFMVHCGIDITERRELFAECRMTVTEELHNTVSMLHGGALATLADCAGAVSTWDVMGPNEIAVTTDFNLTCLKATYSGDRLIATGTVVHRGRRFIRSQVEIRKDDDSNALVATAGVSLMVVEKNR